MQEMSVSQAEEEKEQVKSLISNMSHQLKTPLANIRMYEEILREENYDAETREKFLAKMQTQSEKLEWILNSLFKMVKLEQNVMVFEVSMCPIRKTILDAVNLVYEKAVETDSDQNGVYPGSVSLSQCKVDVRSVCKSVGKRSEIYQ